MGCVLTGDYDQFHGLMRIQWRFLERCEIQWKRFNVTVDV